MKKSYSVVFQMDEFEKINKKTDSTYLLAKESLIRKFSTFHLLPENVHIFENEIILDCSVLTLNKKNEVSFKERKITKKLSDFDFFFIRQDPPFNMNYITNTYLLELIKKRENIQKPFFVNSPTGIRNFTEKIFPLYFKEIIPKTFITKKEKLIKSIVNKYGKVVVKPLYDKGGTGVDVITSGDLSGTKTLKKVTNNFKEQIIIQKFLKKVQNGDKRVILFDGVPVGCINRVPQKGSFKANLHLGGTAEKTILTKKEKIICLKIKKYILKNEFFFVGLDIIDEKLTEINVTSPTGLVQINKLYNTKIEEKFWDLLIKKINY
ncbi:MAG: glutathione synthase [Rickettsiales bacterium]|nr:glutathione synthase [Rickettsiales bacterium]